jgi:hypothetical protein
MLVRFLPLMLIFAGCPDPTAGPEGGGMSDKPMGGGPGGPGGEGGQQGPGQGMGTPPPGGEGGAGGGGSRPAPAGFQVTPGQGVKLSGTIKYAGTKTGTVRVDILRQEGDGKFPQLVHSINLTAPGPWEVEAPKDAGDFMIVAFLDANDNGPEPTEPAARLKESVKIGSTPITGLDLELSDTPDLGDLKPGGEGGPPAGAQPIGAPPAAQGAGEGGKPAMDGSKPPMDGSKPPMDGSKPPMDGAKPAPASAPPQK